VRLSTLLLRRHRRSATLRRLGLILGASVGGMQTWMRGERYPDMMDALLPIASLPERVGGRNLLWRRLLIKIVQLGQDEQSGVSGRLPLSLGRLESLRTHGG
jgi:homoserine O-acetyltransferase/O-succinyltransferase